MTEDLGVQRRPPLALHTEHLSKTFVGTAALRDVSLQVARGEILALLGGNGSGKSTLIKLLAGVHRADAGGTISVGNVSLPADRWTPADARHAGLFFVHQSLGLFDDLTVGENLAIGRGFEGGALRIDWRRAHAQGRAVLERFQVDADVRTRLGDLRPAARTMVAIARALQDQEGAHESVLVLDEPTASLPSSEVHVLHDALRRYRANGQTIIFVSHRLDEVQAIADTVAVLRDGSLVATMPVSTTDERELVTLISGRVPPPATPTVAAEAAASAVVRLEARHLHCGSIVDVDLDVHAGEVHGIAGLLGSGRTSLLRSIFGDQDSSGEIRIDGEVKRLRSAGEAVRAGVAYLPEDRARDAAFEGMSLAENLSAAVVTNYWSRGWLRHRHERADARELISKFGIRAASERAPVESLSGGNQQKAMLARWMRRNPKVLLLDEPTQGVDVGARADIHALLRSMAADGTAVVVVSSDFAELISLCDRITVLRGGRIAATLRGDEIDPHRLHELVQLDLLTTTS